MNLTNEKRFPFLLRKNNNKSLFKMWQLYVMLLPAIIFTIVFRYLPMWGVLIAFKDYDIFAGFMKSDWVGFKHFIEFFTSPYFGRTLRNTLAISFLKLLITFPAPVFLALVINEVKHSKIRRTYQTISYLPHFISGVIVAGMIFELLSTRGSVNDLLLNTGLVGEPINWLSLPEYFWGILVSMDLWKEVGYSCIIYLAAISGINPELYDAASVDGASRLRKIINITLPSIVPLIVILFILSLGKVMTVGFTQILLLTNMGTNTILRPVSDTIGTYVYRVGIQQGYFDYAAAVGLFQNIVNVILLVTANTISKKTTDSSLW